MPPSCSIKCVKRHRPSDEVDVYSDMTTSFRPIDPLATMICTSVAASTGTQVTKRLYLMLGMV